MGVLLPKLKPLLYANGGPIIAVQVQYINHEFPTYLYKPPLRPQAQYNIISYVQKHFLG